MVATDEKFGYIAVTAMIPPPRLQRQYTEKAALAGTDVIIVVED